MLSDGFARIRLLVGPHHWPISGILCTLSSQAIAQPGYVMEC
jgi:hypothetical protein